MNIATYSHPVRFYFLSTMIPWLFWFIAAYLSHITSDMNYYAISGSLLALLGLISPLIIASIMMGPDPNLRNDFFKRIFNFRDIKAVYIIATCFLMLGSLLLAQAISLFVGHSIDQFSFAKSTSFTFALFPAWFLLFLAPMIEELAWHSYGTDCLRARFSLFTSSILFAVFWVFWHLPLAFIKDYYHSNVAETGWLYSLNFAISLFPFVILMNWLYFKTGRNILVPILFHITAVLFNEMFLTHPDSKVIQTVLLLALSIFLVCKEKHFFFNRELPGSKEN